MKHPNQVQLALMAGNDLGVWDRWRVRRHVSGCASCSSEVKALRTASEKVREVTAELPENSELEPTGGRDGGECPRRVGGG